MPDQPEPETPAPKRASTADLHPRSDVRRITQGRLMWLLLLGLLGLLYLTVHYAHRSFGPEVEPGTATVGQRPLDPSLIQRLGIDESAPPEPPPEAEPPLPPAWTPPPPRTAPGRRERERVFGAPLGNPSRRLARSAAPAAGPDHILAELERLGGEAGTLSPAAAEAPSRHVTREARLAAPHPYELASGTVIPAVLLHRLDSDVAGSVRAQVSRDVFDSGAGTAVLVPRGTVALGEQLGRPSQGDARLVVSWRRLRYPDGRTLDLGDQPAGGVDGSLGLAGRLDQHWGRRFGAAVLLSLVGAGVQLSQPQRSAVGGVAPSEGQIAAGELGRNLGQLSAEILRRHVDLPPTVELRPGARLSIVLVQDLVFEAPAIPN